MQVLTAAHCVVGNEGYLDHVATNRHAILTGDAVTTESIPVVDIIYNHCYDEDSTTHDIALLVLGSSSAFAPVEYIGKTGSTYFSDPNSGLPTVGRVGNRKTP
jgi:secreted trypsin-like serine protease